MDNTDSPDFMDYSERYNLDPAVMDDIRELIYGCRYRNSLADMFRPCHHKECNNDFSGDPDLARQMKAKMN